MLRLAQCVAVLVFIGLCAASNAQEAKKKPRRFGIEYNDELYPQGTPADAMKSIIKAIDREKVNYMMAQIADPTYVDYWVDEYKVDFPKAKEEGRRILAFDRLVRETIMHFQNDPLVVKDLRAFAKTAKWTEEGDTAVGVVESIPARKVFFKKIGERWFLLNKQE
jgi:hypothetical protein